MYDNITILDNKAEFKDFHFMKKCPFYRYLPKILTENYRLYNFFSYTYFSIFT